jgi:glycine betaine/choline ABC-type transport system substrate-binding protein
MLGRFPGLRDALNGLAGKIDAAAMQQLNHEVDGKHRDPAKVAREFLHSKNLL